MSRTALVTGGAGFIGSHVSQALLREGWRVRVFDNLSTGDRGNFAATDDIEWFIGDLRDRDALNEACKEIDTVFHLAAIVSVVGSIENAALTHDVNVTGTLNLLDAAKACKVRRVVFSSSASIYGDADVVPTDEDQPYRPESPYASSKAACEFYGNNYARLFGLEFVTLRYFNVFGPKQNIKSGYAAVVPLFVKAAQTGATPTIFGDGLQTRDFIFVEDIARANVRAATAADASGHAFNVAGGNAINLLDLLASLEKASGKSLAPKFEPARTGEVKHSRAATEKATTMLCFSPTVSLEEGLLRTYEEAAKSE